MKIVQFKDGSYAIRKGFFFFREYFDFSYGTWTKEFWNKNVRGTFEQAVKNLERFQNDKLRKKDTGRSLKKSEYIFKKFQE